MTRERFFGGPRRLAWMAPAGAALAFGLATAFWSFQMKYPGCCDRALYVQMAHGFAEHGLAAGHFGLAERAYLYPWLLSLMLDTAKWFDVPLRTVNAAVLTTIYVAAAVVLARVVARDALLRALLFLALCGNVYLLPYLANTLTDGLYTSLCMLWLAQAVALDQAGRQAPSHVAVPLAGLALLAGLVLATRAAGVWIVAPTLLLVAREALRGAWRPALVAPLAFLAPLAPQLWLNVAHYGRWTLLPPADLGQWQTVAGVMFIKYGTNMSGGPLQMGYPNPWAQAADVQQGLGWYVSHWSVAPLVLGAKFVGAFDFDYVMPYVYDLHPIYRVPARVASLALLAAGVAAMVRHSRRGSTTAHLGPRWLLPAMLAAWAAVTLPTAIELRFALPMLPLLLCAGLAGALDAWHAGRAAVLRYVGLAGALLVPLLAVARFVGRLNSLLA